MPESNNADVIENCSHNLQLTRKTFMHKGKKGSKDDVLLANDSPAPIEQCHRLHHTARNCERDSGLFNLKQQINGIKSKAATTQLSSITP